MQSEYEILGKVLASNHRLKTINVLSEGVMTPARIAKRLNIEISHASKIVRELKSLGLVECKTPELRKGKLYGLTDNGKRILQNLNAMVSSPEGKE
jgi:Mn-dependent DtxR family transcriptional regulator